MPPSTEPDAIPEAWGLPQDFLPNNWRRTYAQGKADLDRATPSELPGGDYEPLLGHGLRADQTTVSTGGRLHHPVEYTQSKMLADRPVPDLIVPERVRSLVQNGATVVLANTEHWLPSVAAVATQVGEALGLEVQAHVFVTGPGHSGLVPHVDGEDNVLIQLSGEKSWTLWAREPGPLTRVDPADLGEPTFTVVLQPGDVLYIPLGWVHAGVAGEQGSTHITYQVIPETLVDAVLNQLADELEAELGDRVAPAFAPPLAQEQIASLSEQILRQLNS